MSRVLSYVTIPSGKKIPISLFAESTESDPWMMFTPVTIPKSPRMVPGADYWGLVFPMRFLQTWTALSPSQTIARTGPDVMYEMSEGKNFLSLCSA